MAHGSEVSVRVPECACLELRVFAAVYQPQSPTLCTRTHNYCCSLAVRAQSRAPGWLRVLPFHLPNNGEKLEETHPPLCWGIWHFQPKENNQILKHEAKLLL